MTSTGRRETATLAGGCFWCLDAVFTQLKGVERVVSGYTGGRTADPSYEDVCTGRTGHAEATQITFDPDEISYRDLLDVFFATHDPTTLNRQGGDVGTQYRSAIFPNSPAQKAAAEQAIAELTAQKVWPAPIVTTIEPLGTFTPAEDYHQGFFDRNPNQPYCAAVIAPKVAKFRKHHFERLRK